MKLLNIFKKKSKTDDQMSNFPELLSVKLFFINQPTFSDEKINAYLSKRFGSLAFTQLNATNKLRQYAFKDYEVTFKDGKSHASGAIFIPDTDGVAIDKLESSFHQSWDWKEAETVAKQCNYEISLTDVMSRTLDYKLRIEFFQKFVVSIVEAMNPTAIWVANGEKILSKEGYLASFADNNYHDLNSFLNVRLFTLQDSKGEMIMDTLGLNALGLPDFEIRFTNYNPTTIAALLFNYAAYIFENGVIIQNGNTIQGTKETERWKCYFEESVLEPKRTIIQIETNT